MRRPPVGRRYATDRVRRLQAREELSGDFEVQGRAVSTDIDIDIRLPR